MDAAVGFAVLDLFQYLLTFCDAVVPPEVVAEIHDITQYQDIHAAVANNVLAARDYYTVDDPYEHDETPDSRPTFGSTTAEPTVSFSRTRSTSTGFSPTSSAGRTSHSSTPCYRARGSSRCRGSSSTTPETII